jgi:hypothetical protein
VGVDQAVQRVLMSVSGTTATSGFVGSVWARRGMVCSEVRVFKRGELGTVVDTIRVVTAAKELAVSQLERRIEEKYGPIKSVGWMASDGSVH